MAKDPQVGQETARTSRETISSDILISPRNFCLAGKRAAPFPSMAKDPQVGQAVLACPPVLAEPGPLPKQDRGQASTACPTGQETARTSPETIS